MTSAKKVTVYNRCAHHHPPLGFLVIYFVPVEEKKIKMEKLSEPIGFQTYESRDPCRGLAKVQFAIYVLSFSVTWYAVWWENMLVLPIPLIGIWATQEPLGESKISIAKFYFGGNVASVIIQVIALGYLMIQCIHAHIFSFMEGFGVSNQRTESSPAQDSTKLATYYIILMIVMVIHLCLAVRCFIYRIILIYTDFKWWV